MKAEKHGSPEDQKRRDGGPPQLESWHIAKEKEDVSTKDAARFRASVETDPANDLESKQEACQIAKADESRKLLTDQQVGLEDDVHGPGLSEWLRGSYLFLLAAAWVDPGRSALQSAEQWC